MLPDKAQRLILYNQYEILKILHPVNERLYEEKQEIISNGYEQVFDWMTEFLAEVPKAVCGSVLDALQVCHALEISQRDGAFESTELYRTFIGYDGNHESEYMGYAKFLIKVQGKFPSLSGRPFNSHMRSADKYARMYSLWRSMGMGMAMSLDDVNRVAQA
jgi:hypothetical protein